MLFRPSEKSPAVERLDRTISETVHAISSATVTARHAAAQNRSDIARADELTADVRARIVLQDVRRELRVHDPKLAVILDTVRILEDRD